MKFLDDNSAASDPVNICLSHNKLKLLEPDLYGVKGFVKSTLSFLGFGVNYKDYIKEHIFYGDSQPAIVVSTNPLLIAAYSDELDCIAMLNFPDTYRDKYLLNDKTKLITINTYHTAPPYQKDLIFGPKELGNWFGFHPIIADFVSEDWERIEKRKRSIPEELWTYVYSLGIEYMTKNVNVWRNGRPVYSGISAL